MPGVIDDIMDFLGGSKALKKAAGTGGATPEPSVPCPHCGTGITQSDVAKAAQESADRMNAAKAKQATPAPKAAPKKISSVGDMMNGYS